MWNLNLSLLKEKYLEIPPDVEYHRRNVVFFSQWSCISPTLLSAVSRCACPVFILNSFKPLTLVVSCHNYLHNMFRKIIYNCINSSINKKSQLQLDKWHGKSFWNASDHSRTDPSEIYARLLWMILKEEFFSNFPQTV